MMLEIDGSQGEGGGQILRSCLACSLVQGRAFRLNNIRAARASPGLGRQHLVAVTAAGQLADAEVRGAALHSRELEFRPRRPVGTGSFRFAIGTAGSTCLVAQTLLPALAMARGPTRVTLEGGTHNPLAPPFEFLQQTFLPLLELMGPRVRATLERPGFFPAGGGRIRLDVRPTHRLTPLRITERGAILGTRAVVLLSRLPEHIAERELKVVGQGLGLGPEQLSVNKISEARGPGNLVLVMVETESVTEVFTGFGQRGVPAEQVASGVVDKVRRYLAADVPVGPQLADQLLLPLALAGGGELVTTRPSLHATTNIQVLQRFLDTRIEIRDMGRDRWRIQLG